MTQNLKKKVLYDMFVIHEIGIHFSLTVLLVSSDKKDKSEFSI